MAQPLPAKCSLPSARQTDSTSPSTTTYNTLNTQILLRRQDKLTIRSISHLSARNWDLRAPRPPFRWGPGPPPFRLELQADLAYAAQAVISASSESQSCRVALAPDLNRCRSDRVHVLQPCDGDFGNIRQRLDDGIKASSERPSSACLVSSWCSPRTPALLRRYQCISTPI